jgi:DNA-binding response OmpR family regulator
MHAVILLVDGDDARRATIARAIRRAGHAVLEAADADAIDGSIEPDVLIVDGATPSVERAHVDGRVGHVPTLTLADQPADAVVAELASMLRTAVTSTVQLGPVFVDPRRRVAVRDGKAVGLTDKEAALLAWLMANPHRAVSRSDLLKHVWGYHASTVSRAVDVTVRRLREKIEVDPSNPAHLVTSHGEGYRWVPPAPPAPDLAAEIAALRAANDRLRAAVTTTHPEPAVVAAAAIGSLVGLGTLSGPERAALSAYLDTTRLGTGDVLIREDDVGDVFYVVIDGRIGITHKGRHLRDLGPGEQLGEVGFTGSARRTATATALVPTVVLGLSRARFETFVQREPQTGLRVAMALLNTVGDRLRDVTERLGPRA